MNILYTWNQFDKDVEVLARRIRELKLSEGVNAIYGIPRGGMVLAVVLSHQLDIPVVEFCPPSDTSVLVVDDISDSGKTLLRFKAYGGVAVTIHAVRGTKCMPDCFVHWKEQSDWIVYPWEERHEEGTKENL